MNITLVRAFGETLKNLRKKRGLSQEKLALEAGLDRTFISMLERGVRQPSLTTIFELKKILKLSASEFIRLVEKELDK